MRGIDTSSTATLGWCFWVGLERGHAVLRLCHDLHVGLPVDQHAQAGAHDAVVVGDQHADHEATLTSRPMRSVTVVPLPGAERMSSSPPARRARSTMPLRPSPAPPPLLAPRTTADGLEALTVVADAQLEALVFDLHLHGHRCRAGVPADVRERLLKDPVDRGLNVVGQSLRLALVGHADLDPGACREALELRLDRRHQAVVVERGRAQLAGQVQEFLHRLVHEPLQLGDLVHALGRAVMGERLEAQQDRGERLVHLVVEVARQPAALLLLRAHRERAGAAALLLDALEQAVEGGREPVDLLDRIGVAELVAGGLGGVDVLDALDQALERREAALKHPEVHAQREHDRQGEDEEGPALVVDR